MEIYILVFAFLVSFLLSVFLTPWLVKLCLLKEWTDIPNHRKVHSQPIPRLGGLVFLPCAALSFCMANLLLLAFEGRDFTIHFSTILMVLGAMTIYLVGLVDDVQELKANTKFFIQLGAALVFPLCNLMISNLHGFFGLYELPFYVSYPLTVFIILLITNAMNLIDGIDGLASGLSIMVLGVFSLLFYDRDQLNFSFISICTLGAVLSFFCYNVWGRVGRHKIFMGDSGSLFLGYVISYLAIKYQMEATPSYTFTSANILTSYTLVIIPTFDVIRVALARRLRGVDMFTPDKTHIHHMFMSMGLSMHQTLVSILALFVFFCGLNYLLFQMEIPAEAIVLSDILLYGFTIFFTTLLKK